MSNINRRECLRFLGAATVATSIDAITRRNSSSSNLSKDDSLQITTGTIERKTTDESKEIDYKSLYRKSELSFFVKKMASEFMTESVPVKNTRNNRTEKEEKMFQTLETSNPLPGDILYGLQAAGTVEGRSWGMELLWQQRQESKLEKYGIKKLDQERINWALNNAIDPRVLAICRDVNGAAIEMLGVAKDLFYEAISEEKRNKIKPEDTVPNPGLLSKLNMTETGHTNPRNEPINRFWGFVYIGDAIALEQINTDRDWFPNDKQYLKILTARLQAKTTLPYLDNIETFPGSARGNVYANGSGGAIGPQFMPSNALLIMNWYNEANSRLQNKYPFPNPLDPYSGTIMCYLYLASEFYFRRQGNVNDPSTLVRPGFNAYKTDEEKSRALEKWNPTYQARLSLEIGYDYYARFGRK